MPPASGLAVGAGVGAAVGTGVAVGAGAAQALKNVIVKRQNATQKIERRICMGFILS